ncbi:carboxymuconolactone decarboxylase family protein [Undibacterium sp.]|uniref:carboxymuconolactone decarboxylase family protein n=1 Tax=Undibacterium sp. TaxID=1914977 RepID=UPI002BD9B2A0|nr:carboxymuconolactone decarboxylase family protein [Undibacterium sp.]HTD04044.1 carboxymuconolactone decarboxylase family protein [Undibacterium sp.]
MTKSVNPAETPRIAPASAPYEAAIEAAFARAMPAGMEPLHLFRTMARSPRILRKMFAGSLLDSGGISLREREILILRTTAACGSEYEWGVHVTMFAGRAELTEQELRATLEFPANAEAWASQDLLLLQLADELHRHSQVSDAVWDSLTLHYSEEQLLEMLAIVGYYHTISFMTNVARLAPEAFAARFP